MAAQKELSDYKSEVAENTRKAEEQARNTENVLRNAADIARQEKDRAIRDSNARSAALLNIMRQRQDRPVDAGKMSDNSGHGSSAPGCTGAGLYRPDGEFLVGEAAAARECQIYLRQCRTDYETVKQKLQSP